VVAEGPGEGPSAVLARGVETCEHAHPDGQLIVNVNEAPPLPEPDTLNV
jgi:hypothetical protein